MSVDVIRRLRSEPVNERYGDFSTVTRILIFSNAALALFLSESRVGCEAIGKFEFEPQDFRWIV